MAQRNRGTVGTEKQWERRDRETVGTEEHWAPRNSGHRRTVCTVYMTDKTSVKEAKMNQNPKKQPFYRLSYLELGTWLQASVLNFCVTSNLFRHLEGNKDFEYGNQTAYPNSSICT